MLWSAIKSHWLIDWTGINGESVSRYDFGTKTDVMWLMDWLEVGFGGRTSHDVLITCQRVAVESITHPSTEMNIEHWTVPPPRLDCANSLHPASREDNVQHSFDYQTCGVITRPVLNKSYKKFSCCCDSRSYCVRCVRVSEWVSE